MPCAFERDSRAGAGALLSRHHDFLVGAHDILADDIAISRFLDDSCSRVDASHARQNFKAHNTRPQNKYGTAQAMIARSFLAIRLLFSLVIARYHGPA